MKPQDFTRFTQENDKKWLYKDLLIPRKYTPDLIVEDCVIVEMKAVSGLTNNDEAQLLNYLRATKKRVGLLLNFGKKSLEIKRKIS